MAFESDYTGNDIPIRLWTRGRPVYVIPDDDRVYIRHAALADGTSYEFQIPGHDHLEDQSANSHLLNCFGTPRDVLFDIKHGRHHWEFQIACFNVQEIGALTLPNERSIQRKKDGTVKSGPDVFTFRVRHTPDERMYPHCIIEAARNGGPLKEVPKSMRTAIRAQFAAIAERNRESMRRFYKPGKPVKCSLLDFVALAFCKITEYWSAKRARFQNS
jgi:hypothetical protein